MGQRHCEIVWTKHAQLHMRQAYDYISKDSVQNAAKVLNDIIAAMDKAANNPEMYPPINTNRTMRAVTGLLKNIVTE